MGRLTPRGVQQLGFGGAVAAAVALAVWLIVPFGSGESGAPNRSRPTSPRVSDPAGKERGNELRGETSPPSETAVKEHSGKAGDPVELDLGEFDWDKAALNAAESMENSVQSVQLLLDNMALISQPDDYTVLSMQESEDGSRTAFLCSKDCATRVLVVESASGETSTVPVPPDVKTYECRTIRHMVWAGDGKTLYVIERATEGITDNEKLRSMPPRDMWAHMSENEFSVLYSYRLEDAKVVVLDRFKGESLAIAVGKDAAYVINKSVEKGWGFIDFREYRDGERVSLRTLQVVLEGRSIDHNRLQYLPAQEEIWFSTIIKEEDGSSRYWVAVMELGRADPPEARLVVPDSSRFAWSADGRRMVCERIRTEGTKKTRRSSLEYILVDRDAMNAPVIISSKNLVMNEGGLDLVGFSRSGDRLYLCAQTENIMTKSDYFKTGIRKIYGLPLPR